jgi:shikimate kinase
MDRLWLVGMMGSGKSRIGRLVAGRLELPFVDTDAEIVRLAECSIPDIFATIGEDRFRDLEECVVSAVAADGGGVVATGGGVVLRTTNVDRMRGSGCVVWLRATVETLSRRVREGRGRPLLEGDVDIGDRLSSILAERDELYAGAAHRVIDTDGMESDRVADMVVEAWTRS